MPYSATYSIGYGIGVTELVVRSNVYSSQAAPLTTFIGESILRSTPITVTNLTSTGNSIVTTGFMSLTAPSSNTDFYGPFTGNVINCKEIVGGNVIGQVLSLNTINVGTNVQTTGNVIALVTLATRSNAYTNLISAANIYAGTYIGTVTGQSVSTQMSLTALSTMTVGTNTIGNVLTSGTVSVTGQVTGNIVGGSNTISAPAQTGIFNQSTGDVLASTGVTTLQYIANTLIGSMTAYANDITTSGDITTGLGYIGGLRGDILGSGQYITNEYVGRLTSTVPISASQVTGSVSANSLVAGSNNLSGASISSQGGIIGEIRSYTNAISTGTLTASQVFVGTMTFTGGVTTSGNVTATTLIGGFTGLNVITSGTLTSSGGNLYGRLVGANVTTLSDSLIANAVTGTIVTYANIIPASIVTSPNITAGSMNTFTNSITVSRVSGSFVGPVTTTGIDIFSSGSVIAKNFVGIIDAGSNSIVTGGVVNTQEGLSGSINTFANNIQTQGLITGTFLGKYNGLGPIVSNAAITVTGRSNLFTLASTGTIFVEGTISGNYTGSIQTYGNSIVSTGGLSGSIVFARITAYQNSIVNDGGLSYGKDMLKSNYGNVASYANIGPIQTSISHYYSNVFTRQPWWSTTSSPSVSYVYTQGQTGFSSSVLMPDGRVVFVPSTSRNIGIFDTKTSLYSNLVPTGLTASASGWGWNSGVLLPNSNIAFIPGSNNYIGIYNPYLNTISLGPLIVTSDAFRGGVLLPNGNVVCIPYNTFSFTEFDPSQPSKIIRSSGIGGPGNSPYLYSGTLLPNGNVICAPYSGNFVLYDYRRASPAISTDLVDVFFQKHAGSVLLPTGNVLCVPTLSGYPLAQVSPAGVYSNTVSTVTGNGSYQNACLLGHGKVLFGPGNGTNIGVYDIYSDTLATIPIESGYGAPIALPDGRAILPPTTSLYGVAVVTGVTQLNEHLSTSSYFNKF